MQAVIILMNCYHAFAIFDHPKKYFGKKYWIFMQPALITRPTQRCHNNFLKQFRIKCIGRRMEKLPQRLSFKIGPR
ncbi:MAG: hypothetical protein A3G86_02575 [Gammaproteobacteria bacterium RIFCSPLOWO2_12_FULL_42_18]|nr:MAG: hypothetical protein A3G86_02575 [Gammaproteobacteria bacterium RIFCSPLOWO2_12_FULL_42_18]